MIADDFEPEVTSTLIVNKLRGTFNIVATKAPGFGDNQKDQLTDIAIMTGARFFAKDLKMELSDIKLEDLGFAKKIIVTKENTTIIDGNGDPKEIKDRVEEIRAQADKATSEYDKKRYNERLAKLVNGVAIIKVGALTESELKEKKMRIEDALNAIKAAVEEGIVIGGGSVLVEIYNELKPSLKHDIVDVQKGINVVIESLLTPIYQIAENAGYDGSEIVEKQKAEKANIGFNAKTGEWVDMFKAGSSTRQGHEERRTERLDFRLFITTEAAVEIRKKKAPCLRLY